MDIVISEEDMQSVMIGSGAIGVLIGMIIVFIYKKLNS